MYGMKQASGNLIWASGTATAAGATVLTISLPAGAVGTPKVVRASGSVAATVTVNIGNTQQVTVLVNPNAPPDEKSIPAQAFPAKTGSLSATATLSAAGNVYVAVGFAP